MHVFNLIMNILLFVLMIVWAVQGTKEVRQGQRKGLLMFVLVLMGFLCLFGGAFAGLIAIVVGWIVVILHNKM